MSDLASEAPGSTHFVSTVAGSTPVASLVPGVLTL